MHRPSSLLIALAGMLALAVAMGIGRFAFTPVLPMMQQDAGLSLSAAGWLASANYIGYFLGAVSALWMRFSPGATVRTGLVAIALATLGMGLTDNLVVWLILRGLAGIASAWVLIFAVAWTLRLLAAHGRQGLGGLLFGGVGLGTVVAGICCLVLMSVAWSADRAWIVLGTLAALFTAAAWPVYRPGAEDPPRGPSEPQPKAPASQSLVSRHLFLILCYGLFGFGYIIPATFLPMMAKDIIPDPTIFGWAWPIFGMAAFVSSMIAGWLATKLPHRKVWAFSQLLMAVGVVIPVVRPDIVGIVIAALCVGGTLVVATQASLQESRRMAPENPQGLVAAMTTAFATGQILGPLLVSAVGTQEQGFSALLVIASVLLALSALGLLLGGAQGGFAWRRQSRSPM